jgi:putative PIN family toxin of toxin-antitoxin system
LGAVVPLSRLPVPLRAVFDTNVVISALIFGRRLAWLRNGWASGTLVPIVCRQTADELLRVLAYPKFRLSPADRMALLEDYLPYAEIIALADPPPDLPSVERDPNDAVFLALATVAQVPLITGDSDLSDMLGATGVRLLSVAELRSIIRAVEL